MVNRIVKFIEIEEAEVIKTLKELSRETGKDGSKGEHIVETEKLAIDLDALEEKYKDEALGRYKTADAMYLNEEKSLITLIEFKNRKTSSLEKEEIQLKALESLIFLGALLKSKGVIKENYEIYNIDIVYQVVFSSSKNQGVLDTIKHKFKDRLYKIVRFELEKYTKGNPFKVIFTIPSHQFDELIAPRL